MDGWDVQKALRLLHKSNPALFEWSASPIVYRSTPAWEGLRPLMGRCFSCRTGVHHYLHMAAGDYREHLRGERVRTKKYLYVTRPILACRWIVENAAPPPMAFEELRVMMDPELQPVIDGLLELKRRSPESVWCPRIEALNRWMEEEMARLPQVAEALPKGKPPGMEELEAAFLSLLRGQDR